MYVVATMAIPKVMVTLTRANPEKSIDLASSYIVGSKLLAKANGEDSCVVNVFLLDKNGMGVVGKRIALTGVDSFKTNNEMTDKNGQVTFEVRSKVEGQFKVGATIEGVPMGKALTVTFRN